MKRAEIQLSKTRDRRQEYVDLARRVDRTRRNVRLLEGHQAALRALRARDEAEARTNHLLEQATRLEEWERRFVDGDPRARREVNAAELVVALSGARGAPGSVGTDLDPLEVLEGRLEELDRQRVLVEAFEGLEEAEMRAEELEREVKRLERWEQRFPDADPRDRELMSFTDIASAVTRCNNLPKPGFTDIDPLKILEERISMLDDSSPKPCPSPGDVQRWIIPLRETPPPPRQELQSQISEARRKNAPPKADSSARGRLILSAMVGVAAAVAVWMATARILYGVLAGVPVTLGLMFLRVGSSRHGPVASVDVNLLERQLREWDTLDARVAQAHRFLREWELPLDPDAAIAEFYNRERAWSEQTIERRRLEEMVARRRRLDDDEAQRIAERESAFGELRNVVVLYGGDASDDEGQILGEATYLLNDLQRVARDRQQDVAEWGRFQEALAGRSVEEWRAEAGSCRQHAELARSRAENLAAGFSGEILEMKSIEAEREKIKGAIFRRRRFDEDEARRCVAREEAFGELRRVVVLYGGDGSGGEGEVLRVADGLLDRFERLAQQRSGDVAEWGRFQEALGGRSVEEWKEEMESVDRGVELAIDRADSLAACLETAPMQVEEIEAEYANVTELARRRRRFDEDEARRCVAREEAFGELRRVVVLYGGDGSGGEGEVLRVADGLLDRFERLAQQRSGDVAEWGRFQEGLGGRSVEEWRADADLASREARKAGQKADELAPALEQELLRSDSRETDRFLRDAKEEASRTAGQLEQIDTDLVDVATAQSVLDEAKLELERVQRLQRTLNIASEHLQRAAEHAHRLLAPRLEALMKEWIPIITGDRYVDVLVDPETLEVKLRHMDGMIREAALLSYGTAEQVYLLLRMILAQVLTDGHEPCPVLLDDPTVHADLDRKEQVLEYLLQASDNFQVILFTQDQLVEQWASSCRSDQRIKLLELTVPEVG